jgi:hypothetical protein
MVKNRLIQEVMDRLIEGRDFERAVEAIVAGETDPYSACDDLLRDKLDALKR